MPREELIKLRATPEEKAEAEARARAAGLTLSEFIRSLVFEGIGPVPEMGLWDSTTPDGENAVGHLVQGDTSDE